MFSKTERKYLSREYISNIRHRRVLDHRIKSKIKEYHIQEYPIIQNVTEFSNTSSNHIRN